MTFRENSIFAKVQFIILFFTLPIHVIGLSVPRWFILVQAEWGLWEICSELFPGVNGCVSHLDYGDWFTAVVALSLAGAIKLFLALVVVSVYTVYFTGRKLLQVVAVIFCFLAFACIISAVSIFGAYTSGEELLNYPSIAVNLHFAFAFCIIASIFALMAGILGFFDCLVVGNYNLTEGQLTFMNVTKNLQRYW